MAVNIHITIIELNALHTKRQNLFQELDAVIHLLMEAKHWGLRKSRNATSLNRADLPPSPTKSSNLSETAEVPACNVPSRSPLPALAIAPETKLGTASSGLGTLEP